MTDLIEIRVLPSAVGIMWPSLESYYATLSGKNTNYITFNAIAGRYYVNTFTSIAQTFNGVFAMRQYNTQQISQSGYTYMAWGILDGGWTRETDDI